MTNPVQETQKLGQSIWYDNIRRGLLVSGELQRLIEMGVTGLTSNPTIFEKAISDSTDYDDALWALAREGKSVSEIYETLAIEDIRSATDLLSPVYDRTDGADGYASLEVSPALAHDTEATVAEAKRLFATLDRPNLMVKVPATPEGIPAVQKLIGDGININVTLIFSIDTYRQVMEAYISGLEELARSGGEINKVASVASFFVSRVDTAVDKQLEERISQGSDDMKPLLGKAAIANAKLAYQEFKRIFDGDRFAEMRSRGARLQRPLWGSTGTKNPAYSDVLYVESLIGRDTVNTMPPATLTMFLEQGVVDITLDRDVSEAQDVLQKLEDAGIGMEPITSKLLADGVKAFAGSFDALMANIGDKRERLLAKEHAHPGVSLGKYLPDVESAVTRLQEQDVVSRIWRKDHTVWKPDPTEITDRLGWLKVTDTMRDQVTALQALAQEVRDAGYRHTVLLGMGGSSLGPEVLRQTFGSAPGYPELIVMDTTVPAWVQAVTEAIDPAHALFLVSSKSGGTVETLSGYSYLRDLVEQAVGAEQASAGFIAITDPGTPLEKMAQENRFRRIFLNPLDIGGRYSVLSYFGLVPAALAGIDITTLIKRADRMRESCASSVAAHDNPGAWLGAILGTLAQKGRDKATLVTSPAISSFGLWTEQIIAESTGKEGTGIIPVAGEPLMDPAAYGDDRLFIYLRLEGDDNSATDEALEQIQAAGQPVVRLELQDRYDLGAEFFRWEFATSVAGALLGIHPFDQSNVQSAKDKTAAVLQSYLSTVQLPGKDASDSLNDLLDKARPGDYLAIMAYLRPTPEVDQALNALRRRVIEQYRIATTLGYGPRFLHSTGQLHKGGPDTGLFLQITAEHRKDIPIPGELYGFATLAQAQAQGDIQVLAALGRRVARVHIDTGVEAYIHALASGLA